MMVSGLAHAVDFRDSRQSIEQHHRPIDEGCCVWCDSSYWTQQGVRYSLEEETPLVPTIRGDQRSRRCSMALEPTTQAFINSLGGPPLSQLSPEIAHQVLTDLQSQPIELQDAQIEDAVWPVGSTGENGIRIGRQVCTGSNGSR